MTALGETVVLLPDLGKVLLLVRTGWKGADK